MASQPLSVSRLVPQVVYKTHATVMLSIGPKLRITRWTQRVEQRNHSSGASPQDQDIASKFSWLS